MTHRLRNKGRQGRHVLTVNGSVKLVRRWWHAPRRGSVAPADTVIDPQHSTVSPGVREMACRLNNDGVSFDRAAENLARTAQVRIANVDGADWIRAQLTERPHELPLDGLGLDFYHLSENVHRCRRTVYGEEDATGQTWAGAVLHAFKHAGYEAAWEQLQTWRASLKSRKHRAAADRLLHYVFERREMINYREFQQRGWQIGSGPTESRCKTSTQRLKGRGRRWDAPNAEAVSALTTLHDSRQWNLYWTNLSAIPT